MNTTLHILKQVADAIRGQFGDDCEVAIHDLTTHDMEHSIVYITGGALTDRKAGDGPSKVVLAAMKRDPEQIHDTYSYLTRTKEGRSLKSSSVFIRDARGEKIDYILSINTDITNLLAATHALQALTQTAPDGGTKERPSSIVHTVDDLLEQLIAESVARIGKPPVLMSRTEKVNAIRYLNDAGAFLITRSGDRVSSFFGISKFTLYSYIDINKKKDEDGGART